MKNIEKKETNFIIQFLELFEKKIKKLESDSIFTSISTIGSSINFRENCRKKNYVDYDIVFISKDVKKELANKLLKNLFDQLASESNDSLKILCRLHSGPMRPLRNSPIEPLPNFKKESVLFFHVSYFTEEFYSEADSQLSPILRYSWQNSRTIVGVSLNSYSCNISINAAMIIDAKAGLKDKIHSISSERIGYWRWGYIDRHCDMFWEERSYEDFERYYIPVHMVDWAMKNYISLLSSISGISINKDIWQVLNFPCDILTDIVFFSNCISSLDYKLAEYCSATEDFIINNNIDELKYRAIRLIKALVKQTEFIKYFQEKTYQIPYLKTPIEALSCLDITHRVGRIVNDLKIKNIFIITDSKVKRFYSLMLAYTNITVHEFVLDINNVKTISSLVSILEKFEELGCDNSSLIISFGGGNIGNTAGMAAGLICRGVSFVNIPTTIISQLDSAIGVKQSVNGQLSKNYFGLFHPPKAVLLSPLFLLSNDKLNLISGLAEAMKHGLCQSQQLIDLIYDFLETDMCSIIILDKILNLTIKLKLEYMVLDPFENSPYQFLELGHKVGHAVEHLYHLPHGICVLFGILCEARFFVEKNKINNQTFLYIENNIFLLLCRLDSSIFDDIIPSTIANQVFRDNKKRNEKIPLAYISKPQYPEALFVLWDKNNRAVMILAIQQVIGSLNKIRR